MSDRMTALDWAKLAESMTQATTEAAAKGTGWLYDVQAAHLGAIAHAVTAIALALTEPPEGWVDVVVQNADGDRRHTVRVPKTQGWGPGPYKPKKHKKAKHTRIGSWSMDVTDEQGMKLGEATGDLFAEMSLPLTPLVPDAKVTINTAPDKQSENIPTPDEASDVCTCGHNRGGHNNHGCCVTDGTPITGTECDCEQFTPVSQCPNDKDTPEADDAVVYDNCEQCHGNTCVTCGHLGTWHLNGKGYCNHCLDPYPERCRCHQFTPRYNATTEAATPDEASEHSYTAQDYELARWGVKGGANRGIVIEHPEDDSSESKETASEFTSKSEVPLFGRDAYNQGWRDGVDHVKQRLASDDPYLLGFADGEREFRAWQAAHAASMAEKIADKHPVAIEDDGEFHCLTCGCLAGNPGDISLPKLSRLHTAIIALVGSEATK